jgi:hypothetical protein
MGLSFAHVGMMLASHPDAVYVVDGRKPAVAEEVTTLAVTSPHRESCREYTKSPGVLYEMKNGAF